MHPPDTVKFRLQMDTLTPFTGCAESPGAFQHFIRKCNWLTYIQQQVDTVTGNNKPHLFTNRSLDVITLVGNDGIDARAEALARTDDADRLQRLPYRHVASLERLQVGMRSGLDIILQNARHVVIERVEVGWPKRPNLLPPEVIWPVELLCHLGLCGVGVEGGCSVLLEDKIALLVGRLDRRDEVRVQEFLWTPY